MPGLQRQAVLHHGFDGIAPQRAGELLGLRLHALDHRHRHHVLGHLGVDIEHAQHFLDGFFVRRVRGVSLLPEKFRGPQEHARAQLPADDVRPLVHQHRQVAPALNPLREEMADDGFRRRPDDVRLFELFAARDGHHRQLRRETLDVLRFLLQKALRDEQRKIHVLMARWP